MKLNTIGIAVTAALVAGACATTTTGTTSPDPTGWNAQWRGVASDTLMKSEIGATMPLRPLAQAGNMYALGPVSGIKGEVAMWDSDPVMGMVVNGKPAIVRNIDAYASWLIWSQVKSWKAVAMPNRALSYAEINDVVSELAVTQVVEPDRLTVRIDGELSRRLPVELTTVGSLPSGYGYVTAPAARPDSISRRASPT